MNEKRPKHLQHTGGRQVGKRMADALERKRRARARLCPATGSEHELDDGRCLNCGFDVEYTA